MSQLKQASEILVFCSVLYRSDLWHEDQLKSFLSELGVRCDFEFFHQHESMHSYYDKEMGGPLSRFFATDSQLRSRDILISLKLACDSLERRHSRDEKRSFNLDPGYIAMEHVLLATGKPYAHRAYLGQGVYAELTYAWEKGAWKSFPWTYPDYAHEAARDYFELMRCILAQQLRTQEASIST